MTPQGDEAELVLADLIDACAIQALVDEFYGLVPIPMAVIDLKGKVLVGVGWQDICTQFHRVHPETSQHCIESDTVLSAGAKPGDARLYKCKNNMLDLATPIMVAGRHVGNVFTGQFFFDDEPVDYDLFRAQAARYGFEEKRYLDALDAVPRLSRRTVQLGARFLARLAHILSQSSLSALKLERAQQIAHLGSWELDLATHELTWSDEVYRIFGLEPDQAGATYEAFLAAVHPDDRATVREAHAACMKDGSSHDIEHRIVRKGTNEVRWVHQKCEHARDQSGQVARSFGMVLDITERKESEQALKAANERLEEADRRKNEFLAMLAHELRNPLSAISNAQEVLERQGSDNPTVLRSRELVGRQVRHLARMIDDLLDVGRITHGTIALQPEKLSMAQAVEHALSTCRWMMEERRHTVALSLPSEPVWVDADRSRIEQIISNLLVNAVKYTDVGGRISIFLERKGAEAVLRVCDTGRGIDSKLLQHIFEPFVQGDCGLARSTGGLGVGLTLVQRLTALHGGTVQAHSPGPGQGAEFVVKLPVAATGPAPAPIPNPLPEAAPEREVLVVDDNRDAADTLADVLKLWGHRTRAVYGGAEALEAARSCPPDLVLLDLGMPDMDGCEVARRLRELQELQGTRIVALTGYGHQQARDQVRAAGFDGHLIKPVAVEELEHILRGLGK